MPDNRVNVGLVGCGEVAQVIHIPTLQHLSSLFNITYLADVSPATLAHCASKLPGPVRTTHSPEELCSSPEVDVVLVSSPDEYHALHAVAALRADKHVLVEKPLALTRQDAQAIAQAERESKATVMVGYMRRYAAVLEDALREIGGIDKILYARVRDIIGPNSVFVEQSGTFPVRFDDVAPQDSADKTRRADSLVAQAMREAGDVPVTAESTLMWRVLAGLGSHDLSLMREALGMPEGVIGASLGFPFWNVLFKYPGFTVSYESGMHNVPRFDAHIEVYGADKSVRVQYDTPYVRGLPVTMRICEKDGRGEYRETTVRKTYEDAYTAELRVWWEVVMGRRRAKTTVEDAMHDLELFSMAVKSHYG